MIIFVWNQELSSGLKTYNLFYLLHKLPSCPSGHRSQTGSPSSFIEHAASVSALERIEGNIKSAVIPNPKLPNIDVRQQQREQVKPVCRRNTWTRTWLTRGTILGVAIETTLALFAIFSSGVVLTILEKCRW